MAALTARCAQQFDPNVMSRGWAYARDRRVALGIPTSSRIAAGVRGSSGLPYRVIIAWPEIAHDFDLQVSCQCPHFTGGSLCKHVWATLVVMDAKKLSGLVPGDRRLTLSFRDEVSADLDGDGGSDDRPDGQDWGDALPAVGSRHSPTPEQRASGHRSHRAPGNATGPDWQTLLALPERIAADVAEVEPASGHSLGPITYVLDRSATLREGQMVVAFCAPVVGKRRESGEFQGVALSIRDLDRMVDPEDREILALLLGALAEPEGPRVVRASPSLTRAARCRLHPALGNQVLPRILATGRLVVESGFQKGSILLAPLTGDVDTPWTFRLIVESSSSGWIVTGCLERGSERLGLEEIEICLRDGYAVADQRILRWEGTADYGWFELLRSSDRIQVPAGHRREFLERLWSLRLPRSVDLPENLRLPEVSVTPTRRLICQPPRPARNWTVVEAACIFDYDGFEVRPGRAEPMILDAERDRMVRRDLNGEASARDSLLSLGFQPPQYWGQSGNDVMISAQRLPEAAARLLADGWHILAEGRPLRPASPGTLRVRSGIDWFELEGGVRFGEELIPIGRLLAAQRRGEAMISLGDGSTGLLPEEWLGRLAPLANLGTEQGDALRFRRSQASLLDALLAARPDVDIDASFQALRKRLDTHGTVQPVDPPPGFTGTLRPYQKTGLGWFGFLREIGFGGCLADDMGLGKTVQVLALLEDRRTRRLKRGEKRRPSLVVVPRSLVHNWMSEATRFTPKLRVLDYTGTLRHEQREARSDHDLIISTYGTLLRDIPDLSQVPFDYAILDEAQAIKNGMSQAAKASLLLQADHRLAMSGTPIQNHLGELASLLEFLNPGLLGRSTTARALLSAAPGEEESLGVLARAVRPFILRRTKENVLKELPPKTEQTIFCELGTKERRLYESLRNHYRDSLTRKIAAQGMNRSRMHVLEALLRLRQAACHPGLVEKARKEESSAKLDALLENLQPIIAEGHKALVFSQFTSLLALVRARLDREGIRYEYLDGRTRDRPLRVERFQTDPDCPVFLISLKAGGLGLNLTAAGYVYILDPWWNPAVEAQAVDRAHRMGQSRTVFAYRLIAQNTVEEKILELQRGKIRLAEAIISSDTSVLKGLTAEDIELLLS